MIEIKSRGDIPEQMKDPRWWIGRILFDLFWFCKVIMHHGKEEEYRDLNWIHQRLCDFLDFRKNPVLQKLVIMFRDGLKSSIGRALIIQWFLNKVFYKSRGTSFIYSGIVDLAEDHAEKIAKEILENKLIQGFFYGKVPRKKSEFDVCKKEKIRFKGIEIDIGSPEKSLTGHHYELGVNDNLVNEVNSQNSTQREKIIKRWKQQEPILKEHSKEIILETTWWPDDVTGYILGGEEFRFDFETLYRKPCFEFMSPTGYAVFSCPARGKGGVPVWPAKVDDEYLERKRKKMGSYLYNALYELQPTVEEDVVLRPSWILHYEDAPDPYVRNLMVDMAGTKGEQSTYTGMSIGDWAWTGRLHIAFAEKRKLSPAEVWRWVLQLIDKCIKEGRPIKRIGIEREKFGIYLKDHLGLTRVAPRVVLVPHGNMSQDERLSQLISPYENGMILSKKGLKDYENEVKTYHRKKTKGTDILNTIWGHLHPFMKRLPSEPRKPSFAYNEAPDFEEQLQRMRAQRGGGLDDIAARF
jgi:hypothetical protein